MAALHPGELAQCPVDPAGAIGREPHTPAPGHKQRVAAGLHALGSLCQPLLQSHDTWAAVWLASNSKEHTPRAAVLGGAKQDGPGLQIEVVDVDRAQLANPTARIQTEQEQG